jgi:hypothetical protein
LQAVLQPFVRILAFTEAWGGNIAQCDMLTTITGCGFAPGVGG